MMDCFVEKGGGGEEVRIIIVLAVSFDVVLSRLYTVLASRVFSLSSQKSRFFDLFCGCCARLKLFKFRD